jgi:hypothetical protein
MIMAAVAYNLKKLIKGTPVRIRTRIRKAANSTKTYIETSLAAITILENLVGNLITNDKSKWLNNHLLCKLNYSAI